MFGINRVRNGTFSQIVVTFLKQISTRWCNITSKRSQKRSQDIFVKKLPSPLHLCMTLITLFMGMYDRNLSPFITGRGGGSCYGQHFTFNVVLKNSSVHSRNYFYRIVIYYIQHIYILSARLHHTTNVAPVSSNRGRGPLRQSKQVA